jgi:tRNA_anti-like
MNKRRIIVGFLVLVIIIAGIYAWREYNRTVRDLDNVTADYTVEAVALINEFTAHETDANSKYQDKIIAVQGLVKKVDQADNNYTVVLGDTTDMSSVRCLMDSSHVASTAGLQRGQQLTIKGAITGFKKDDTGLLGSDVELTRCIIVQ